MAVSDGAGGETVTWTTSGRVWGALRPLRADERTLGGGTATEVTHRVVLRRTEDLAETERLVHESTGTHWRVVSSGVLPPRAELELYIRREREVE